MSEESDEVVVADGETLTPADVEAVARRDAPVEVPASARAAVRRSRERVVDVVESGEPVYGVNTGFGSLVNERVAKEDLRTLQHNLLRSHASGAGRELDREEVRALLLTRVNALVKGYSGVREAVVDRLVAALNEGVHPVVKSRGSLGASGDLAPLAHASLVLIGEGRADVEVDGETRRLPGDEALGAAGLEPLSLEPKEGLALINGTQLTVGLAALAVADAERALRAADAAAALTTEVTMGTTANCDPAIQAARPHEGQATVARNVKRLTEGSEIVESHRNCDRVQDAYSIRCVPQVHGAVRDAVRHLRDAVEVELNSATDNPLLFDADDVDPRASGTDEAAVLSGGNFHGMPLALRLDYLTSALAALAGVAERRVDRMVNPNLQEDHLPPFLADRPGLESGLMIPQYTAAALVNEVRSLGRPSTDNVPVSGGQEDFASMSAQSAFHARTAVENALTAVSVELLAGAEASEYVDDDLAHGAGTAAAHGTVRGVAPALDGDRPLHADVDAVTRLVREGVLDDALRDAAPALE